MKELKQYINKADIIAEIEKRIKETESMQPKFDQFWAGQISAFKGVLKILDSIEVKETDMKLENENRNPKIAVGTKIRLKTNPNVILNIISNDCHEDEFECSNGSVLSLKQIEKYYDIYEETQEDKELLLKDICTRLPYGVKVLNMAEGVNEVCELDSILTSRKHKDKIFVFLTLPDDSVMVGIEMVKPYLRPMSSMTEEEWKEYQTLKMTDCVEDINGVFINAGTITDWLNAHHFDYRGLIERGLAIEAPEGIYN